MKTRLDRLYSYRDVACAAGGLDSTPANYISTLVKLEKEKAVREHGNFKSSHEAHSVIEEEFDEFWDEVKKKESERDYDNMLYELVQIAACAQKYAEQLYADRGAR